MNMEVRRLAFYKSLFMTAGMISLVAFSFMLIFLRIHSLNLERDLRGINRNIERYSTTESELKQTVDKMTSFAELYSYCKETLGMSNVRQVERIQVFPTRVAATAPSLESRKGWRSGVFSFLGFSVN